MHMPFVYKPPPPRKRNIVDNDRMPK